MSETIKIELIFAFRFFLSVLSPASLGLLFEASLDLLARTLGTTTD